MKDIYKLIANSILFKGLPEDQLKAIKQIAILKQLNKGETIFSEGDDGTGFYIVAEGLVKIFKVSSEGKEHILHIFSYGEPFGEVAVFSGEKFPANAEAINKSSLLFFPRNAFVNLITQNPSISLNMLSVLSKRLRQFTIQIENLSLKEVPGRLAGYLIYLSDESSDKGCITLDISKGQLASLLGTIPETLSRILARMTEQHLVEVKGRQISLINREALEQIAEQGKGLE